MYGIVSILEQPFYEKVESIWQMLENDCGLKGIRMTPIPHFSWQVAEGYNIPRLEGVLRGAAASEEAFSIHTAGLGVFSGVSPVIYISMVKDEALLQMHKRIYQQVSSAALGLSRFYTPEAWIPHITLAHGDVNLKKTCCALELLVDQVFDWEIRIDNLAVISEAVDEGEAQPLRFQLGG